MSTDGRRVRWVRRRRCAEELANRNDWKSVRKGWKLMIQMALLVVPVLWGNKYQNELGYEETYLAFFHFVPPLNEMLGDVKDNFTRERHMDLYQCNVRKSTRCKK